MVKRRKKNKLLTTEKNVRIEIKTHNLKWYYYLFVSVETKNNLKR